MINNYRILVLTIKLFTILAGILILPISLSLNLSFSTASYIFIYMSFIVIAIFYKDIVFLLLKNKLEANKSKAINESVRKISFMNCVKQPTIFIVNSKTINCFSIDFLGKNAVIFLTSSLVSSGKAYELEVLLHREILKIKSGEVKYSTYINIFLFPLELCINVFNYLITSKLLSFARFIFLLFYNMFSLIYSSVATSFFGVNYIILADKYVNKLENGQFNFINLIKLEAGNTACDKLPIFVQNISTFPISVAKKHRYMFKYNFITPSDRIDFLRS